MKYAAAIDIGGTNTRIAIVSQDYSITQRIQFPTDANNPYATMDRIVEVLSSYGHAFSGIGLSCPGPLDLKSQKILTPPNLHGEWHHLEIAHLLQQKTNVPVYLDNDANLAGYAEAIIGEGKDMNIVQFFTISTGFGAGLVINREIVHGSHGFANEVANTIVMPDGPSHGDIVPGGIEAVCSGTAIETRARKAGLDVHHAGEVNDLALAGNEHASKIMLDAKVCLANYLAGVQAYIDPDIIILGGSVAMKINGFVEEVEAMVKDKVYPVTRSFVNIRKSTLGEDGGLLGAACLCFEKEHYTCKHARNGVH